MSYASALRLPRFVGLSVKALVLAVLMVALTSFGVQSNRPPTAVLGNIEVVDADAQAEGAGTVPQVQLIDAVCITNTPTQAPC